MGANGNGKARVIQCCEATDVHRGLPSAKLELHIAVWKRSGPEEPVAEAVATAGIHGRTKPWVEIMDLSRVVDKVKLTLIDVESD